MTSKYDSYNECYVWVWLPGHVNPVVAGRLVKEGNSHIFNYGRSYLGHKNALPLYLPELPLTPGALPLLDGLSIPGCIRDASPDAWGRRVIINSRASKNGQGLGQVVEPDELACLLESGSDRIGALDFQLSPESYVPRREQSASLSELMQAAEMVQQGVPLSPALDLALRHGTPLGGARPKAMLEEENRKLIAKFSMSADAYSFVKAEFIAMRLATDVGLNVAPVKIASALGKDVLLVDRFDRVYTGAGWQRKAMVSALTMLELDEMMAAHASYETLVEIIRYRFTEPKATLRELFGRLVFNILCGNTDDHARNHAAFWDGQFLTLTPAYDICPQPRTGNIASQGMLILGTQRQSQLSLCLEAAPTFLLSRMEAEGIIKHQIAVIKGNWDVVCEEAALSEVEKTLLWGRQFLNPSVFDGTDFNSGL